MSEEEFTIESIGMEESYCDHSCILRGEEVISDGIPSADARSIVEILNGLYDENRHLKAKASSWKRIAIQLMAEKNEFVIKCHKLEKENRELNSIKKFAERNGINIFLIEEAFRKCWKDNGKLFEENEKLQKQLESSETTSDATSNYNAFLESKITTLEEENEQMRQELNGKDCRKCGNYCRDKALDYCLVDEREPSYFSPLEWDYKAEAEKCKYYYR